MQEGWGLRPIELPFGIAPMPFQNLDSIASCFHQKVIPMSTLEVVRAGWFCKTYNLCETVAAAVAGRSRSSSYSGYQLHKKGGCRIEEPRSVSFIEERRCRVIDTHAQ